MATTGSPLDITLMNPGEIFPHSTFNAAVAILNRGAQVDESLANEVSITTTVTLTSTAFGKMHVITGTSADYTITLPTPVTADLGKIIGFRVSNAGTKLYTLDAAGAETIDGATTYQLRKDDVVYLKAVATTGNTWQVVGKKTAPVAARVYNNANISIPNATPTALTFNSERRDDGTIHDTGTNTDRLTAPIAGWYFISGNVEFATSGAGVRAISIVLNGGDTIAGKDYPGLAAGTLYQDISTHYYLNAGDYVKLVAYQDSGAALNVLATAQYGIEFGMARLG